MKLPRPLRRPETTDPVIRAEVAQRVASVSDRAHRTHEQLRKEAERNGFAERWQNALRGA